MTVSYTHLDVYKRQPRSRSVPVYIRYRHLRFDSVYRSPAMPSEYQPHTGSCTCLLYTSPPVSVYGTGTIRTIAAFLDAWLTYFPTFVRSASRLRIDERICQLISYLACTGLSIPGLCSPHVSPQFCHTVVQEFQPVIHRLRLSASP